LTVVSPNLTVAKQSSDLIKIDDACGRNFPAQQKLVDMKRASVPIQRQVAPTQGSNKLGSPEAQTCRAGVVMAVSVGLEARSQDNTRTPEDL
jgi:hypothetical protein